MDLPQTETVLPQDERPARRDGTCFYCSQPLGTKHNPNCIIVSKTITVRLTLDVVIEVPRTWGKEQVEFARNENSWCVNNMMRELQTWFDDTNNSCACGSAQIDFVRDATEEDHSNLPLLVEKH